MKKILIAVILLVTIQSSYTFSFMDMIKTYMDKKKYKALFIHKSKEEALRNGFQKNIEDCDREIAEGNTDLEGHIISKDDIDTLQSHIANYKKQLVDPKCADPRMVRNVLKHNEASLKIKVAQKEKEYYETRLRISKISIAGLEAQLSLLRLQLREEVTTALEQEGSDGKTIFSRIYRWFIPKIETPRFEQNVLKDNSVAEYRKEL